MFIGLFRLQDFFKEAEARNWKIKLHQFEFGKPYRDTFWKIKEEGELNIILDVKNENIFRALKHVRDNCICLLLNDFFTQTLPFFI